VAEASGVPRVDPAALADTLTRNGSARPHARLLDVREQPIGIGHTADTLLLHLRWQADEDGPRSLVAKVPALDERSARTARTLGLYEREARFYADLAPKTALQVPTSYGTVPPLTLLLQDLTPSHAPRDQFADLPESLLRLARAELVALQAAFWDDPATSALPWLHRRLGVAIPAIHERMRTSWTATRHYLAESFDAEERDVVDRFVECADAWARSLRGPFSLTHHDFRVDNMLFRTGTDGLVVLDWQTVGWGVPMFDLAYLLGTSLNPRSRRELEAGEIRAHVDDLARHGIHWSVEDAWTAYRQASFAILLMLVPPTGSVKRTPRGDDMFRTLLRRGARMALDLEAEEFLPRAP
jgi:hypothetical protein